MLPTQDASTESKLPARRGLLHVLDAAAYSWAGFCRLTQETAARLELACALIAAGCFVMIGASWWQWAVLTGLFALLLTIEALNTAIEIIVDRVSPEWSEAAKNAKDLGSLAVGLMLLLNFGFVLCVFVQEF